MNKRNQVIKQSRLRAMRKALGRVGRYYAALDTRGIFTPEKIHQIKHLYTGGSNYGACLALRNRGDAWLLRAFRAVKKHGCGGSGGVGGMYIDFSCYDHRAVVYCIVHGNLKLSEHGKKFFSGINNSHSIVRLKQMEEKMKASKA